MIETKYSEAAVEVLDILNYTDKEDVKKIPQSFIKFLNNISDKNYKLKFNHEYPINGLNLKEQTKELLGFMYITWWCNEEEHNKYKRLINPNNEINVELSKQYDINDIFKNRNTQKSTTVQDENTSMIEYKEETLLRKLFNKILYFFRGKR